MSAETLHHKIINSLTKQTMLAMDETLKQVGISQADSLYIEIHVAANLLARLLTLHKLAASNSDSLREEILAEVNNMVLRMANDFATQAEIKSVLA